MERRCSTESEGRGRAVALVAAFFSWSSCCERAEIFIAKMSSRIKANRDFIMGDVAQGGALLKNYEAVIGKTV